MSAEVHVESRVPAPRAGLARRLWSSPVLRKNLGAAAGLLAVFILFTALLAATRGLSFADPENLETILRQTMIVSGGIDLSVGAVIALATVVIAGLLHGGAPPALAALGGLATGLACGALN